MRLFIILCIVLSSTICLGQILNSSNLKCSKNGSTLLFVNGVNTTREQAREVKAFFERKLNVTSSSNPNKIEKLNKFLDAESDIVYDIAYNKSEGIVKDLFESSAQKLQKEYGFTRDQAYHFLFVILNGLSKTVASGITKISISFLTEKLDLKVWLTRIAQQESITNQEIKDKFWEHLLQGRKLILLSHSQGNLFVNSVYSELLDTSKKDAKSNIVKFNDLLPFIGNLQVATPASRSFLKKNDYITNEKDVISLVPGSAPWNKSLYPPSDEDDTRETLDQWINHGFLSTYLHDWDASDAIYFRELRRETLQKLVNVAGKLDSNCSEFHLEMINVSGTYPYYYLWLAENSSINGATNTFIDVPEPGEYQACIFDGAQNLACKKVYVNNSICELLSFDLNGSLNFDLTCDGVVATVRPIPPLLP